MTIFYIFFHCLYISPRLLVFLRYILHWYGLYISNYEWWKDILNHFHIRQGEKLSDPEFGTIIWDVLFDPLTEQLKEAIVENVTTVINYDPRVQVTNVSIDQYESGLQIEIDLSYLAYNISENLRLQFDQNAGFLA